MDPSAAYTIDSAILAEGSYGVIRKCQHTSGLNYAVKVYKTQAGESDLPKNVIRELALMQGVSHENVLPCIDFFHANGSPCMVLPLLDFDLEQALSMQEFDVTEGVVKGIFRQILYGLREIHQMGFLHRDLTPHNILIDTRSGGNDNVKIADFGTSGSYGAGPLTQQLGKLWYRAPEIIMRDPNYGPSVDIWSAACMLTRMYADEPLFACKEPSTLHQLVKISSIRGPITDEAWPTAKTLPHFLSGFVGSKLINLADRFPSKAAEFLDHMLAYDPLKRPTADACIQDTYFSALPLPTSPADYPWIAHECVD